MPALKRDRRPGVSALAVASIISSTSILASCVATARRSALYVGRTEGLAMPFLTAILCASRCAVVSPAGDILPKEDTMRCPQILDVEIGYDEVAERRRRVGIHILN
jgi:hypothetical protein